MSNQSRVVQVGEAASSNFPRQRAEQYQLELAEALEQREGRLRTLQSFDPKAAELLDEVFQAQDELLEHFNKKLENE